MKKVGALIITGTLLLTTGTAFGDGGGKPDGKKEFVEHCAACHKDGGNIMNPKKTLKKADREANGIKKPSDIVKLIREPGPGMTKFDRKAISDKEAKAIADYILKAF